MKLFARWSRIQMTLLGLAMVLLGASLFLFSQRNWLRQGADSYVYGYPLVMMDLTRNNFANSIAPPNQLVHIPVFPEAGFRDIVRPNVDTLYSIAWLDLAGAGLLFEVPATERYYVMQFMDGWTNVYASIGSRTSGSGAGRFLLVGPQWQGTVPADVQLLRSPTRLAWLLGRIQTNGAADYPFVRTLQKQFYLTPLEQWQQGKRVESTLLQAKPASSKPPLHQIRELDSPAFFSRLLTLMHDNPPSAQDHDAIAGLADLGLKLGQPAAQWNWLQRGLIDLGRSIAERKLQSAPDGDEGLRAGWRQPPVNIGNYGQDYGFRAVVAMHGLGANLAVDAVYPNARQDASRQPLRGDKRYRLHFAAGQLPPSRAFWSVTAYDDDGFLIANALNRYALGDRDPLKHNADGSLDLYVQAERPAPDQQSNWLPVSAKGSFSLTARIYWPKSELLDGKWQMPGIEAIGQ